MRDTGLRSDDLNKETTIAGQSSTPNNTERDVRHALQTAYAGAGNAWRGKDAEALMRLVTPDFVQLMPDGQVIDRPTAQAGLEEWFAQTEQVTRYVIQIEGLTLRGDEAVAEVDERVTCTFADPTGRPHVRDQANTARMTWVKTADGWRIRRSEYLTAKLTVDGTPVQPLGV